jgi:multidrug transporter EmrE-like cation transporter
LILLLAADRISVQGAREPVPAAASGALFGMSDVVMKVSTELVREHTGEFELQRWPTLAALLLNPEFHLAIGLATAAFLVQQFAFSRGRVSVVAPIIGVGATAVAVMVGFALLREPLGALRTVGIAAVLSGTFFLGRTDAPVPAAPGAMIDNRGGGA